MLYTLDKINNLATKISLKIPHLMLFGEECRKVVEETRRNWMKYTFTEQMRALNNKCGSRQRKSTKALTDELTDRGIDWYGEIVENDMWLVANGGECAFRICDEHGLDVTLFYDEQDKYEKGEHCTAKECDLADLIDFIIDVDSLSKKRWRSDL